MQRLDCHVKEYAWGKHGSESEVATLFAAGHPEFAIEKQSPYAELWMGTHPDGPARLAGTSQLLSTFLAKTQRSSDFFSNDRKDIHLPFIMKVMSIAKTLSLQVHPTKEHAERLHEMDPAHYPDRHHKPELAYALSEFQLLCGFRPAEEMATNLRAFGCLRKLLGPSNAQRLLADIEDAPGHPWAARTKTRLAACFAHQLALPADVVAALIDELLRALDAGVRGCLSESAVSVIRKASKDFPGDVGVFGALYLNHVILQPGECCFYAAQELHAYLSGECVECVGCSNNTIRAALTPKYIDHEALVEALNYQMTPANEYLVPARTLKEFPIVDEYAPDCKDFQLHRIRVSASNTNLPAALPTLACGSILVVYRGSGTLEETKISADRKEVSVDSRNVRRGDIIYIPANRRVVFAHCTEDIEAFRTFSFESGPDHQICAPDTIILSSPSQKISPLPGKISRVAVQTKLDRNDSGVIFEVEAEMDGFC